MAAVIADVSSGDARTVSRLGRERPGALGCDRAGGVRHPAGTRSDGMDEPADEPRPGGAAGRRARVDVGAIVTHLRRNGYDGWYVLEQDTILAEEPTGEGPVADVRTSAEYLRTVLAATS
jgi:hypothetical protein